MLPAAVKQETLALTRRWFLHLKTESIFGIFGLFQPVLWLILFGTMFSRAFSGQPLPPEFGNVDYLTFQTAGMVVFTVLGTAVAGGIPFMFDKESGFMEKLFAAPIHRGSLLASRFLFITAYSTVQALLILALARLLGVHMAAGWAGLPVVGLFIVLLCAGFALLSMILAFVLNSHADFFTLLGFLTTPLLFLSNALMPLSRMPKWVQVIAYLNPLTYGVLGIRAPIVYGLSTRGAWGDMGLALLGLLLFDALMLWAGVRVFKRHLE